MGTHTLKTPFRNISLPFMGSPPFPPPLLLSSFFLLLLPLILLLLLCACFSAKLNKIGEASKTEKEIKIYSEFPTSFHSLSLLYNNLPLQKKRRILRLSLSVSLSLSPSLSDSAKNLRDSCAYDSTESFHQKLLKKKKIKENGKDCNHSSPSKNKRL